MIDELRGLTKLFHCAEDSIAFLVEPLMKRRGMTHENVEPTAKMLAAFLEKAEAAQPEGGAVQQ